MATYSFRLVVGNEALFIIIIFPNQVLGRQVYTSNNQLGGIEIMYKNGMI